MNGLKLQNTKLEVSDLEGLIVNFIGQLDWTMDSQTSG